MLERSQGEPRVPLMPASLRMENGEGAVFSWGVNQREGL